MATGDSADIVARVRKVLPRRWFSYAAALRDALLGGVADGAAWCYSLIGYAALQTRLKTATGIWLDIASRDFLGTVLPRRKAEGDTAFSARLIKEVLRPRNTRAAISQMLVDLTSRTPVIIELWNPRDCGGYGIAQMGGYGTGPGCYGSLKYNAQVLVNAYRSPSQGIPNVDGYGGGAGGYGVGTIEYGSLAYVTGPITDAEIYARIAQTIAAGTTAWVALSDNPTTAPNVTYTPSSRTPTYELLGF